MSSSWSMAERRAIVVMGVAGCGKTSVGEGIAAGLAAPFVEGDALHPAENVAKMSAGVPLTDADREPWLDAIAARIAAETAASVVVSCSALKLAYRDRLRAGAGRPLIFVYLHGTPALLAERIGTRAGHFMPTSLLGSQLAALEDPSGEPDVVRIEIDAPLERIIAMALAAPKVRG